MSNRSCGRKTYRLNDAQRALAEEHYGLVAYTINRFFHIPPQYWEDVMQIGTIGLCRAAYEYDPAKQISFSTYAVRCIRTHVRHYFCGLYAPCRDIRNELMILDKPIGGMYEEDNTLVDYLADKTADTEATVVEKLSMEGLLTALDRAPLTERERFVLERYLAGYNLGQTGEKLGITRSRAGQLLDNAKYKARQWIERDKS